MKKLISVLLVLTMVLSIAGCSGGNDPQESSDDTVTLTMWAHQNEPWNAAWEDAIAAFEAENEGIKIKLETFPNSEFESKIQTSLIDGESGADIYEMWGGWALDFVPYGTLMALPDDFADQVKKDTYEATYGAFDYEGKLYGVPLEFNIENGGLLVNLNLMEQKNLSVPNTWDELRETAIAGTEYDGNTFQVRGFDFVNLDQVTFQFLAMILQQGAQYMTEDGKFDVTTPEAKQAFEELASFVTVDKVTDTEALTGSTDMESHRQLFANHSLMVPRGPWVVSEGVDSFGLELGTDFDYVALPWYGSEHKFAAENGWSLAVNASSPRQEAAMKFIEYVWQDDVMLDHNIRCTQIPSKKSLAESEEYLEAMPYAGVLVDILDDAQFIGNFNTERVKEAVNDVFLTYCNADYTSVDEALMDLNTRLNGIFE